MIQQPDIEKLINRYGALVRKIAEVNVKNKQNTDDIFQETFIKVLEHKNELDSQKNIRAYIARIAFNIASDYSRNKYNLHEVPINIYFDDLEFNDEIDKESLFIQDEKDITNDFNDNYALVRYCIDKLPMDYSNVIACIYYREMSIEETAYNLNINERTVRTRLHRARKMLEKYKEKYVYYGYVRQ